MLLIKIGGGKNINLEEIVKDISFLLKKGEKIVVVHGASETRDELSQRLGIPSKKITSPTGVVSVYTDKNAIDVFLMSYCGLINKKIVSIFQKNGINAVGLSGIDGGLWRARKKQAVYEVSNGKTKLVKGSLTGKVEKTNSKLVKLLVKNSFVPVICPPAISYEGEIVNTDNDFAVAVMAKELKIKKIVTLFEAAGMLKNADDNKTLIKKIKRNEIESYLPNAKGTMKKKIMGTKIALEAGVEKIYWGDGRIKSPVLNALKEKGTVIF